MKKTSKKYNLYLGKSGQFAIMSKFLARGWNTCTPDVDVGDDVLVLEDRQGQFKRVQVKTATLFSEITVIVYSLISQAIKAADFSWNPLCFYGSA